MWVFLHNLAVTINQLFWLDINASTNEFSEAAWLAFELPNRHVEWINVERINNGE